MKSKAQIISSALGLGAAVVLTQAPQAAQAYVIDFTSNPAGNVSSALFPSTPTGINLTASNPVTFGTPAPTTFNAGAAGLCAWAESGGPLAPRCGYSTAGQGIEGFKFKFDQPTTINSFLLASGAGVQNIASATLGFSLDGVNFTNSTTFADANAGSVVSLTTPFFAPAGANIFVRTSATLAPNSLGGVVRIAELNAVPGPLPILGAAGVFGWSRKLRRRILTQAHH